MSSAEEMLKDLGPLPSALSKMPRPTPPRRAFELDIKMTGDTWKDVIRELRDLVIHIEQHGTACTSVSGGYSTSHTVQVRVDESITHESFAAELEEYLPKLKEWEDAQPTGDG